MWLGRLLWLIALAAFVCPPAIAASALSATAMPSVSHHCADKPPPCPESGSARHAAGLCCPFMAHAMAVLPQAIAVARPVSTVAFPVSAGRDLTGLSPHQDPPPPRV